MFWIHWTYLTVILTTEAPHKNKMPLGIGFYRDKHRLNCYFSGQHVLTPNQAATSVVAVKLRKKMQFLE